MNLSNLSISDGEQIIHFPPDCIQTLEIIALGSIRRTVNGRLVSQKNLKKYRTILQGKNFLPMGFDGFQRGQELILNSIQKITQSISTNEVFLQREPVEGSLFALDKNKHQIPIKNVEGRKINLDSFQDEASLTYSPILEVKLIEKIYQTREWGGGGEWKLVFEEV